MNCPRCGYPDATCSCTANELKLGLASALSSRRHAETCLATRTQERDEARAAFVECYRELDECDHRREECAEHYAALYAACTKGGRARADDQHGPPRGGW